MTNTEFKTGVINPIECVKEGFELIKKDYWLLFAIGLVGGLIGGATLYILLGAMLCGIMFTYLKVIDRKPIMFDDLWKGMNYFGPGLIVILITMVPMFVFYAFIYISMFGAIIVGSQAGGAGTLGAFVVVGTIDLIFMILMVCFHTLLTFSFPLIVDRNLGAIDAMKTSASAVWQNIGGVAGLVGVNMVLMLLGVITCGIGLYFIIPIMIAGNVVAYRRVFPSLELRTNLTPTPPDSYKWS